MLDCEYALVNLYTTTLQAYPRGSWFVVYSDSTKAGILLFTM